MMIFYLQYVGISPVHYGIIILIAKIWDAVNDPLIGMLMDRYHPKSGDKFRPWLFWVSFPAAITGCLIFLDSHAWPYWARIVVCLASYCINDVTGTVLGVGYGSMNSTITADTVERGQLSTWRSFGSMAAMMLVLIVVPQIAYKKEIIDGVEKSIFQGQNFFMYAIVAGFMLIIGYQFLYHFCVERIKHTKKDETVKYNFFNILKNFFTNRAMLGVSLAVLSQVMFLQSAVTVNSIVFQVYFGDGSLAGIVSMISMFSMLIIAPFVKPMTKQFGKKALCSWPMLVSVFCYMIIMAMPHIPFQIYVMLTAVSSLCSSFYTMVGWSLVSDGIDAIEIQTGRRDEGSIYATFSLVRKIGQGIGQSLVPFTFALIIPGMVMSDAATWNSEHGLLIKNIAASFPLIGSLIIFISFKWIYDLSPQKMAEIRSKLSMKEESNV